MNDRCKKIQKAIAEILAEGRAPASQEAIERHLEECSDCRRYQQGLLQLYWPVSAVGLRVKLKRKMPCGRLRYICVPGVTRFGGYVGCRVS